MTELDERDKRWAERAGEALRDAEHDVPPAIAERLAAARREAVAVADASADRNAGLGWWPKLAGASAVAVAALAWVLLPDPTPERLPAWDDTEMAAAAEAELLEDLEFVAWMMAMEDERATPPKG